MKKEILEKIYKFTRRTLTEDEIYVFSVILCDNDIGRDGECFSNKVLEQIAELFVGKTGAFNHTFSSSNQMARIFDTEIVTDNSRITKNGDTYRYVKANAYMIRTDENRSLIAEIDGGIKKEVSISCSVNERKCSICGCSKSKVSCFHKKDKSYGGKQCCVVLEDITDAYEWSFVVPPVQTDKCAKFYTDEKIDNTNTDTEIIKDVQANISPKVKNAHKNNNVDKMSKHEILVPAILYREEILREYQKRFYTDDMLFESGSLNNWLPNIVDEPNSNTYQFAIVDNDKRLIGYLVYYIDWYTSCASRFGLMSFDKGNRIIGLAVYKTMRKLIYECKLHRIEFHMVGGNPVERHYDKICSHFGGTKHVLKDVVKDRYGHYHDDVIYEIIRNEEEK